MNLSFSPEDLKFQEEVRSFLKENYPADTKRKMDNGIPLQKEDIQEWQKVLSKKSKVPKVPIFSNTKEI